MEGSGNGKGVSSTAFQSRLSPLAQPFSSNRFSATATEASASVLESFYDFHLEDLLDFSDDSYFAEHPSENTGSDCGFTPSVLASSFSSNKNASSAKAMFDQGNPAVKGTQPYGYNSSETVHEQFSDLTRGRENLVISIPTGRNNIPMQNSFPAVVLESSDTSSTISPLHPISSKNVNPNGNSALKNYDTSLKCSPSGINDLHHLMSADVKEIHHGESPNVNLKGNSALKNYDSSLKCSPSGIKDLHHLMSAEGKEIRCYESPNDQGKEGKDGFSREGLARLVTAKSEEAASLSKKWDEDDLDVDSPCWKGTLASRQSPFARSLSSDFVDNEQEGRNRLNPLAPHYFPRPSNSTVSYHAIDCSGDVLSTFSNSESSAVKSSSKGLIPVDQAVSKSPLLINGFGTKSSSDIHELERDYARINNAAEGLSYLLSSYSKTDVPSVLSAMHDLSQWLLQNFSDDLESFGEHEHDLIQDIFNNLSMCIQHRAGGKTPISEKTLTGTPYYPNKSTELHTCSSKGFQLTRTKPSAVLHELDYHNGYEGPSGNSHVFDKRILDSVTSWSGLSTEKSNSIIQVMGNNLRDNNLTKEELDPEALVYKKLWLDAEAALRSLKYETYILCMNLEMGGYQVDENKAPGKLLTTQIHQL